MKTFTDWQLEQYVLSELPVADMLAIKRQAESDAQLQARINALHESNLALKTVLPANVFAHAVLNEANQQTEHKASLGAWWSKLFAIGGRWFGESNPLRVWSLFTTAAAFVLLTVLIAPSIFQPLATRSLEPVVTDGIRLKGLQPFVNVYRLDNNHAQKLDASDQVQPGDLIQLSYVAADQRFGYIVSLDGHGVTTAHFSDNLQAMPLEAGGEQLLAFGYRLDDAPEFERFFFVSGPKAFSIEAVNQALAQLALSANPATDPLDLVAKPDNPISVYSFTLYKTKESK